MTDVTAQAFREAAMQVHHRLHQPEDVATLLLAAAEQREQWDAREETRISQLAAISTASIQNTLGSRKDRITPDHPCWSVAYSDVCRAIDREIALREQLDAGRRGPQQEECILPDKHPLRIRAEKAEAERDEALETIGKLAALGRLAEDRAVCIDTMNGQIRRLVADRDHWRAEYKTLETSIQDTLIVREDQGR